MSLDQCQKTIASKAQPLLGTKIGEYLWQYISQEGLYNGIYVPEEGYRHVVPNEKAPNVEAIKSVCRPGDAVICIGGGKGVSPTHAAQKVGDDGHVTVFEADPDLASRLQDIAEINSVAKQLHVKHALVGNEFNLEADIGDVKSVPVSELPKCDILELDCEGAERSILETLEYRPSTIIVETHPQFGAGTHKIRNILGKKGYNIVSTKSDSVDGDVLVAKVR